MIEEATRNARNVAQKFAEDSQSTLGDIRKANQGQFSITSDDVTPQIKRVRVVTTIDYALRWVIIKNIMIGYSLERIAYHN